MKLSTRNQLPATVVSVQHGSVMSTVKVELGSGDVITASITLEAAQELGLAPGVSVTVLIKSTEVMLGVED
jgi:molybdopterin-binding protein